MSQNSLLKRLTSAVLLDREEHWEKIMSKLTNEELAECLRDLVKLTGRCERELINREGVQVSYTQKEGHCIKNLNDAPPLYSFPTPIRSLKVHIVETHCKTL